MDEGPSRRSLSPYHEKCFPPYCDNAQLVDKALVSKMSRGELEDKYITFADENLDLKKQNQIKERQLQRLQTAIQRQDKLDKKNGMTPTSVMAGSNKMANLESENKNLQAKVKVLKQQLMNHSYIHSKEARIADAKLKQGQVQAKTPRESEFVIPSQTQSAREAKPDRNVAALKMRITELENQLETNKNKYKNRLGQLEKELAALEKEAAKSGTSVNEQLSQTSRQVKDNTELIKMRMQADKQAAELEELRDLLKTAEEEAKKLKQELKDAKDTVDDLQNQLDREKNKSRTALSEASKGTTHAETIRALEEQIRDLQKEKETLKDTNEKLLQLTQTKSEKSLKSPSGHSILISDLEKSLKDKMDELEELEAKTKDLEQQLFEAKKKPITPTQSVKSVQAEVPAPPESLLAGEKSQLKLLVDTEAQRRQRDSVNEEPPKECEHCVDLSKQLTSALKDNAKLKAIYQNSLEKPKTPPPTPVSKQSDEALKNLNQRLEDELTEALQELNVLRPIAEEHKNCPKFTPPPITFSKSIQMPGNGSHVSFKEQPEELVVVRHLTPEPSKESVHSQKTIDSERYIALTRQLQQALWENEQLKKELENRGGDEHLKRQNQLLEDELNKALRELREVKPIAEEHNRHCGVKREEIIPVEYYQPIEEHLVPEYAKEITSVRSYGPSVHSNPPTQQISVSPARSHTSMKVEKERRKIEWPPVKSVLSTLRKEEIQSEFIEKELSNDTIEHQNKNNDKNVKIAKSTAETTETKGDITNKLNYIQTRNTNLESQTTEIKVETTTELNYIQTENTKLESQTTETKGETTELNYIQTENTNLESLCEINTLLEEIESEFQFSENLKKDKPESQAKDKAESQPKDKAESQRKVGVVNLSSKASASPSQLGESNPPTMGLETPQTSPVVNTKRLLRRRARAPLRSMTHTLSSPPAEEDELPSLKPKPEISNMADPASIHQPYDREDLRELIRQKKPSYEISSVFYDHHLDTEHRPERPSVSDSDRVKSALVKHQNREDILNDFFDQARQGYVSHVSPPPSEHCVRTVDINDPAQRANLVIVSKHDFDTVLTKKRKYSTEVEMMETVEGAQTLNCKLEICMYDLDIDARMLEYLSSIQPEPKVYVEWSFVGLDQRTAPLPADQALFYTNVMYLGPLSNEVKNYLNKNEMPIDLYLVKSSGNPVRVAEGTLDMLPAMEQPNRGFIRSVYLRGKDLPSRYALDKPVATIHCSFILHECCFGDPPFRDQMEVSIGTLYLKNRDGGVIPDHATHIYIEYALLGHCGPDLETDSVPRGEIMKFNHVKKLRVNDENAPHLKAMLEDRDPKPLRFTVCAEPCSLTTDTEVETVGHADLNLNEEMIRKDRDLVSSQVPVYSMEGEHLGTLSVTLLGIGTLQQIYADSKVKAR